MGGVSRLESLNFYTHLDKIIQTNDFHKDWSWLKSHVHTVTLLFLKM